MGGLRTQQRCLQPRIFRDDALSPAAISLPGLFYKLKLVHSLRLPHLSLSLPPTTHGTGSKALQGASSTHSNRPLGQPAPAHPFPVPPQLRPALEVESFSPQDGRFLPSGKAQRKEEGQAGLQSLDPEKSLACRHTTAEPGSGSPQRFQPYSPSTPGRFASRAR